jgi:cytochrome P450
VATTLRPPGPGGSASHRRAYLEAPLGFLQGLQREFGDLVYFKLGLTDVYLVSDPDLIRAVLITHDEELGRVAGPIRGYSRLIGEGLLMTSDGERYRRQRRLLVPAFHHRRVVAYGKTMVEQASRLADSFREGEARDVQLDMLHLTLGIVIRCLFGAEMPPEAIARFGDAVTVVLELFDRQGARFVGMEAPEVKAAIADLDEVVYGLIAERRAIGEDRGDLLSMLLLAIDEDGDGSGLSDEEVRGEILALIAAGYDTTSSALTWTWYLLSQHPDLERRLHAEVDAVVGERRPTAQDLARLPFLDHVVNETLRLFPPSGLGTDRLVLEDIELGGYPIAAGSIILMSQYVVQRDPRWYPDPEAFDPDRWEPARAADRPRFAYFPFSQGSRACIGAGFASMELPLVIASIGRGWRLELEPGQRVEVDARVSMRPKYGMRMLPIRR